MHIYRRNVEKAVKQRTESYPNISSFISDRYQMFTSFSDDIKEKIQKALSIKEKSRTPSKLNSFTFQNAPLRK